jgi:hypothetical protein
MRDIGYKSTAFALAELIDNSIQATATQIDIVFGFDQREGRHVTLSFDSDLASWFEFVSVL